MNRPAPIFAAALVLLIARLAGPDSATLLLAQQPNVPLPGFPSIGILLLPLPVEPLPVEPLPVEPLQPSVAARPISADTPAELLARLASDRFLDRDLASKELIRRGEDAIPILMEGAKAKDTEVAYRCTSMLLSQLDAKDAEVARAFRRELAAAVSQMDHRILADAITREFRNRLKSTLQELTRLDYAAGFERSNRQGPLDQC